MNLLGCLCSLISAGLPGVRQCESAAIMGQQGHREPSACIPKLHQVSVLCYSNTWASVLDEQ